MNLELVRQGYGQVYSGEAFQDIDLFPAYQRHARDAAKGLWNANDRKTWEGTHAPDAVPTAPAPVPVPTAQAAPAVEDKRPDTQKVTVYVTRSGTKYHSAGCSYLRSSSIPIDLQEAKKKYGPCSRCRPPG